MYGIMVAAHIAGWWQIKRRYPEMLNTTRIAPIESNPAPRTDESPANHSTTEDFTTTLAKEKKKRCAM